MKNCDTCSNFTKILSFNDGRKGICEYTDWNIKNMKWRPCKYYQSVKFNRNKLV